MNNCIKQLYDCDSIELKSDPNYKKFMNEYTGITQKINDIDD